MPFQKIYFGIDVWAQNKTKLTQPRITYPEKGGGGTNTGIAINKLAEMGLSACVFAPAWSFEHFPGKGILNHGMEIDSAMWEGRSLPASLPDSLCSCGDVSLRHPVNREHPIIRAATHFPASTDRFFYTDFSMPFARHSDEESHKLYSGMDLHSQLSAQSVLPHPSTTILQNINRGYVYSFTHSVQFNDKRPYLCITANTHDMVETSQSKNLETHEGHLSLFKLDMPTNGSLRLSISYLYVLHEKTQIYLRFADGIKYIKLEEAKSASQVQSVDCDITTLDRMDADGRLLELGVCVRPVVEKLPTDILRIYDIRIVPQDYSDVSSYYSIQGLNIEKVVVEHVEHWRLQWTYLDKGSDGCGTALTLPKIQHSEVTGPFSYFMVEIDDTMVGRSYALEHILPSPFAAGLAGKDVPVILIGIGFDGREIARHEQQCVIPQ